MPVVVVVVAGCWLLVVVAVVPAIVLPGDRHDGIAGLISALLRRVLAGLIKEAIRRVNIVDASVPGGARARLAARLDGVSWTCAIDAPLFEALF